MVLGKRKNNNLIAQFEPLPKRFKFLTEDYFFELERTFKRIKLEHNKECKINLTIIDDKIVPVLSIDDEIINPYFLDFY